MSIARFGRRQGRRVAASTAALLSVVALTGAGVMAPASAEDIFTKETAELEDTTQKVSAHVESDFNTDGYDRFIVSYKEEAPEKIEAPRSVIYEELYKAGMQNLEEKDTPTGAKIVETDKKMNAEQANAFMDQVRSTGQVEYIEPDVRMNIMGMPSDEHYDRQWAIHGEHGSKVEQAWETGAKGDGEVVAVIDTGITNHPDLNGNLVEGYDFISDPNYSRDGDGRDSDPTDEGDWFAAVECPGARNDAASSWHGTHVAGIVAASANNEGIIGAAPNAKVQPIRALGKCGGSLSDIADAMIWASGGDVPNVPANPTPAKIINLSLGGQGQCSRYYQEAVDKAVANGAVIFVAAGNENQNAGNVQPASCDGVITVGATGEDGARADYSNYGGDVDISAPGGNQSRDEGILSTVNAGSTTPTGPTYAFYQGTSMATPLAAGVAALMRSANQDVTADAIEEAMRSTVGERVAECSQGCGDGIVDAAAAVNAVGGSGDRPAPAPGDDRERETETPDAPIDDTNPGDDWWNDEPEEEEVDAPREDREKSKYPIYDYWLELLEMFK